MELVEMKNFRKNTGSHTRHRNVYGIVLYYNKDCTELFYLFC